MNYNQELGKKLKTIRLSEKLTLSECSEITGLSVGFLSQIENGKTSIAIDNLQLLADCFGVDISYFFESDAKKKNVVELAGISPCPSVTFANSITMMIPITAP